MLLLLLSVFLLFMTGAKVDVTLPGNHANEKANGKNIVFSLFSHFKCLLCFIQKVLIDKLGVYLCVGMFFFFSANRVGGDVSAKAAGFHRSLYTPSLFNKWMCVCVTCTARVYF